ncbi:MAG: alpha/beta fold hydrolase [Bryobacteraceae bacterium]|nr:alpha/beta fold hydrolase [Bryobacteraceae bacterium]
MRILLAQNSPYYPAHGGGDRSNRLLLEALATRGHACRALARTQSGLGDEEHERYLDALAQRGVREVEAETGAARFRLNGVEVRAITSHPNLRAYVQQEIESFAPDVILTSTDDPAQLFIEIAMQSPARVAYLARTTLALPFGPEAAIPSAEKAYRLRQTDGVVAVSEYVANYIRAWGGIEARALPISPLDPGPYPEQGAIGNEFVTMVNPCAVKGITIFLALADRMTGVAFAAVPTWGTTAEDIASLRRRPNVRLLAPVDDIGDILRRTRALLAPSLWAEARGRIIVEAMLRGIPVLASKVGGIPEAKMGVDYLLPVRPITRYQHRLDEQMVPVADVPEQDAGPWQAALEELLSSRERYGQVSRQSRAAALAYAAGLSVEPLERYLAAIVEAPGNPLRPTAAAGAGSSSSSLRKMTPDKLALLAARMKRKAAAPPSGNPWFPTLREDSGARLRLFCFPYAGGGTSAFRSWPGILPLEIEVAPARLPGREARFGEPPFQEIEPLVEALLASARPHLEKPYALFGHSMGAMIALELARAVRREGLPGPRMVLAAAARAPQFRRGHIAAPEPPEEEFLAELRDLQWAPSALLEDEKLLRLVLPALRADSSLCRTYSYAPEPALDCPIAAYHGADDPRLPSQVIEPWREQTTAAFRMRALPGGHFFLHTAEREFLEMLSEDLKSVY